MKPIEVVDGVKKKTRDTFKKELIEVRDEYQSKMTVKNQKACDIVLHNCFDLLEACRNDTDKLNEVSNIFNVGIYKVASVLLRGSDISDADVTFMLKNFNEYVTRKTSEYQSSRKSDVLTDINVINNMFKV